ncbi:hypothetical protein EDC04DRAFT_845961 [Pisolithus marmoratus]|nr:hypothetical protein EDC04DRAFT_845961 [Pisolithus marmoratus]
MIPSDPPAVQQYECSSSLVDISEPRAEEDGTETVRGRVLPPGVGFSQSDPAAGNALHSFSWSSQTWCKAKRHPDTQVIVYQCKWDAHGSTCERWIEGGIREIRIHLRNYHGIQGQVKDQIQCKWSGCAEEFKYGSIPRHVMTHLKVTFRLLQLWLAIPSRRPYKEPL